MSELGESVKRFPTRVANQTKQKGKETSGETHITAVLYTPPRSPSGVRAVLGQSEDSPSITYYLLCSDSTRTLLGLCSD